MGKIYGPVLINGSGPLFGCMHFCFTVHKEKSITVFTTYQLFHMQNRVSPKYTHNAAANSLKGVQ